MVFGNVCHVEGEGSRIGIYDRSEGVVSCRTAEYKYVEDARADRTVFYTVPDDGESLETCAAESVPADVRHDFETAVEDHLDDLYEPSTEQGQREVSDETKRRLEDLGYVD